MVVPIPCGYRSYSKYLGCKKGLIICGQKLETPSVVYYLREIDDDKPIFNYGAVLTAIKIAYILPTKLYHDVYHFKVGTSL